MIVIKLDHFNFKPLRPKDGFGQLLDADDFRLEFNLSSESERRLYLTRQNYYDDRLKILHEYIKFAKQNFESTDGINNILDGLFLLFNEEHDINKVDFYIHIKYKNGIGELIEEPIGQFQLQDRAWNSETGEISNSFILGFKYPWYLLSEEIVQIRIIPLLIRFYFSYGDKITADNKNFVDLLESLSYICIA
jgi:hypothetical protein